MLTRKISGDLCRFAFLPKAELAAFKKCLHYLTVHHPHNVIFPETSDTDDLVQTIENDFDIVAQMTPRATWNRNEGECRYSQAHIGLRYIQELSARDNHQASTLMTAADK